ncbi:MAG TPA: class I SAM-dependent methyltransferase [Terracidiphilus sp.]|jgi:cyclopropane-fatty-acyl-phospholipid synthase|nr:class I SAM-dependent methyltransferase [Terracidiphilus sp.]
MSHESTEPGRGVVYKLPARLSDQLRSLQFDQFFHRYHGTSFSVRTADGWAWSSATVRTPEFVATFRTREELDAVIGDAREATLGRIFLDGDLDIQGNIFALVSVAEYTLRHSDGLSSNLIQMIGRISFDFSKRLIPGRKSIAAPNWHRSPCPLDLPAEFFEPWLGSSLGHFCAQFRNPEEDFESAQRNALARVCGWLALDRGDRILDVGCGWGSLLLYSAEHHGTDALGITSSGLQAETAMDRICRGGLEWKCAVSNRDLRASPYPAEAFDKITDLGIFEQVSSSDLGKYLGSLRKMLAPGGLLLLHRMTRSRGSGPILRSMHPDLLSEPLSKELETAEMVNLELLSVETLQQEYEETLRVWIARLRQNWISEISRRYSREYRAWLLYLVEIATSLYTEEIQIHQILLRRPRRPSAEKDLDPGVSAWEGG